MPWRMNELSAKTLTAIESAAKERPAVRAAHLLLKGMLKPYGDDPALTYRYEHSLRAASHGVEIARGEGWRVEPLLIACLLHDVGYPECRTAADFSHHQEISARIAALFLEKIGYDEKTAKSICRAIQLHNLWEDVPGDVSPFELSVRDADDLDRFDVLRTYRTANDILGSAFICDRSARRIMEDCQAQLRKIDEDDMHVCATHTAQRLWQKQIERRREYYMDLIGQMMTTFQMEANLSFVIEIT